jgi:hypothetical protein
MLRKRALIESANDELKHLCRIEHTRHRCFHNFIINVLSALAAYSFFDKKPSIDTINDIVEKTSSLLLRPNSRYFTFTNDGKGDVNARPFDKPFYLKLNLAWGGNRGGQQGVDESKLPATYEIDYVRVYQKK